MTSPADPIATILVDYVNAQNKTEESKAFASWAVEYSMENRNSYGAFLNVFLSGPKNLTFENVQLETGINNPLSGNDYDFTGISEIFTEAEFNNVVNNLSNEFNDDPIELYLLAAYKNSKLLNSSLSSVGANAVKIGEYYLTPHYSSQNQLVFYSAWRSSNIGIEYIIKGSALNNFKENYTTYKYAADLFYLNGNLVFLKFKLQLVITGGIS